MTYFDEAKDLIRHSKEKLPNILSAYEKSLKDKTINNTLLIEIKNFMENLRSALDYAAHGLFEKFGDNSHQSRIYFPYAWKSLTEQEFQDRQIIERKIPGLTTNRHDIATKIETYQHFNDPRNSWLPTFMELNNENKHQRLTPQEKKVVVQRKISSGGASISMGGGSSIRMGKGSSIRMGNAIIPGGQIIDSNHSAKIYGNATQEVIKWVSFHFTENDEPVLPLLKKSLNGVEKIVDELSKY